MVLFFLFFDAFVTDRDDVAVEELCLAPIFAGHVHYALR